MTVLPEEADNIAGACCARLDARGRTSFKQTCPASCSRNTVTGRSVRKQLEAWKGIYRR